MEELAGICGKVKEMAGLWFIGILGNLSPQPLNLTSDLLTDLLSSYVFYIQIYLSIDSLIETIL